MSWRWWSNDEMERVKTEQTKSGLVPRAEPAQETQGIPDPHAGVGLRGRAMHWLQRAYGNQRVQRAVEDLRGSGTALDPAARAHLQATFGQDLGDVRVHTEPEAQAAALELGARAFTDGADIFFAPEQYDPNSSAGRKLLAHEVAHTIQQSGGSEAGANHDVSGSELQAARAAERSDGDQPLDFALTPAQNTQPALAPGDWGDDVRAAQALTDPAARAQAQLALIRRALGPNITVNLAGGTHPASAHPDDYHATPEINFDPLLNAKHSYSSGGTGYALTTNYGYSFHHSGTNYSVLGPRALDPASEILTRMYAEHELYLSRAWLSRRGPQDPNRSNQELDLWVHDFVGFFHQTTTLGLQWAPLIDYYERADPSVRPAAIDALAAYYNAPPVATADVQRIQQAFATWFRRRLRDRASSQFVQDLESRLHLGGAHP